MQRYQPEPESILDPRTWLRGQIRERCHARAAQRARHAARARLRALRRLGILRADAPAPRKTTHQLLWSAVL